MDREDGPRQLDYLVGGLRVSLAPDSLTPGPRSHITGIVQALNAHGVSTRLFVVSEQPFLRRFAWLREGTGAGGLGRRLAGDAVRLLACAWSAILMLAWSRGSRADIVYERAAVLQYLGLFHRRRRHGVYVVESNGIFTRETAADRQALGSTRLAAWIERRVYRGADLVVAVSSHLRDEVCSFAGIDADRVLVLPNAIPDAAFAVDRRVAPGHAPLVGFAGSLVPWQRLDLLIRAAASVEHDVRVEILGDGPELPRLQTMAEELGAADRVTFLGPRAHEETLACMAGWTAGYASHVATSSDSMYHSPLKLYEYAGLGLALIATRTRDAEELSRDGVRVHFVDGQSEASVRKALTELVTSPLPDEASVQRVRETLRLRHSWTSRVRTLMDHLA